MVKKGLIDPNHDELRIINLLLEKKKFRRFFSLILEEMLARKIRIFLRKSKGNDRFINYINFAIRTAQHYPIGRARVVKRLSKILSRYDHIINQKIRGYRSPKSRPIIDLIHNLSKISRKDKLFMPLTFKAGQETLLSLFGNPYVNPGLEKYKVDPRVINRFSNFFERKEFIGNLILVAA